MLSVPYFASDYKNIAAENETMVPVLLNYEVVKHFSVTGGAAINSNWGFKPFAGIQYALATRKVLVVIVPGIYLAEKHSFETLSLVEYKPAINKKINFIPECKGYISAAPKMVNMNAVICI